jgi:hypothetical protein
MSFIKASSRSRVISRSLAAAALLVIATGILVTVRRLQARQNAIRALDAIEETDAPVGRTPLGLLRTGTANVDISVQVEARGPNWLRRALGERRSREWIDEPNVVLLYGTVADDGDLRYLPALPSVREVVIGKGCHVTSRGLAFLKSMPALEILMLHEMEIRNDGMKEIGALTQLTDLTLEDIQITDEGLAELGPLTHLRRLNLASTPISDAGLTHVAKLSELEDLNLSWAKHVTGSGIAELTRLSRLHTLALFELPLSPAGWNCLEQLVHLKTLYLSGTGASDETLQHLRALTELEILVLKDNAITDEGLEWIVHLPRLRYLDLSETRVSDIGLERLAAMPVIQGLDVERTFVTANGAAAQRFEHPGLHIDHEPDTP